MVGQGEDLAFKVKGNIVDENGSAIEGAFVWATINKRHKKTSIEAVVEGNLYKIRIPANFSWFSVRIFASNATGDQYATRLIRADEIRQVASGELNIQLTRATRQFVMKAISDDQPVAGANIRIELSSRFHFTRTTDSNGVVVFQCPPDATLDRISAWKDKQLVGGYSVRNRPDVDPNQVEHQVELFSTRHKVIAFIDEDENPIPDVRFQLNVGPPGDFMETDRVFDLQADPNGQLGIDWFPDREGMIPSVKILDNSEWTQADRRPELFEGVYRIYLKRSAERKRVTGQLHSSIVESLGGFNVELRSFQGERERTIDITNAFTNPDGTFVVDVLPGSTYCFYLNDPNWVSRPQDQILFDTESNMASNLQIEVVSGQEVRVIATQGADRKPFPNLPVRLSSDHRFSWTENGETRSGSLGKSWYVYTDEQGMANARCIAGILECSVYSPEWRFENKVDVVDGKPTTIEIHRPVAEAIRVAGTLRHADDNVSLQDSKIVVAAFDGHSSGEQTVIADEYGNFEFATKAGVVALYARTPDGAAAAFSVLEMPQSRVDLTLQPTVTYHGRLLGQGDQPLANHLVKATVSVEMGWDPALPSSRRLNGDVIEVHTDAGGYYTVERVPVGVRFTLSAINLSDPDRPLFIGERYIQPDEKRPLDVRRFATENQVTADIRSSYVSMLKNCELYDLRLLAIVASDDETTEFAQQLVGDYDNNKAILGYLPMIFGTSEISEQADKQALFETNGWNIPDNGCVQLIALNGAGEEVSRATVDTRMENARSEAIEFIIRNEPPSHNATQRFAEALQEAKMSDRVVWAQYGQTRCGPCFRLSRWIDEHRSILEKDFVFVKVDDVRDEGGVEIAKKITGDRHFGIPFVAIFNSDGELLIDSNGPLGNIGFPSSFEGTAHLRKMISQTAQRITDAELDQLVEALVEK